MIIFNVDMDNTIIYSYKHDIGNEKKCAEIYQEREISFITDKTQKLLREIGEKILVVPTTTRTIEQYERIKLGLKEIPYALVCNGGVLLVDGKEDEEWYKASMEMIESSIDQLERAEKILENDSNICFEIRNIKGLFIFTKSSRPEESVKILEEALDTEKVDVFSNGVKVYVVPKKLSKGNAVKRFRERLTADKVIAAGDSEFDVSMLQAADVAIAPAGLELGDVSGKHIIRVDDTELFSEKVVEAVYQIIT